MILIHRPSKINSVVIFVNGDMRPKYCCDGGGHTAQDKTSLVPVYFVKTGVSGPIDIDEWASDQYGVAPA